MNIEGGKNFNPSWPFRPDLAALPITVSVMTATRRIDSFVPPLDLGPTVSPQDGEGKEH